MSKLTSTASFLYMKTKDNNRPYFIGFCEEIEEIDCLTQVELRFYIFSLFNYMKGTSHPRRDDDDDDDDDYGDDEVMVTLILHVWKLSVRDVK